MPPSEWRVFRDQVRRRVREDRYTVGHALPLLLLPFHWAWGHGGRPGLRVSSLHQHHDRPPEDRRRTRGRTLANISKPVWNSTRARSTICHSWRIESVNFVMASNIFEHVSRDVFRAVLGQLRRAFANEGTLCILQPNFAYAYRQYFDDYTHVAIYSHVSVCDFLQSEGFEILSCFPRFLPLSVVSRLPIHPLLIRLYLLAPWKPRGKQM